MPELRPDLDTARVHAAERITMRAAKSRSFGRVGRYSKEGALTRKGAGHGVPTGL
jgi:hypothetical protein